MKKLIILLSAVILFTYCEKEDIEIVEKPKEIIIIDDDTVIVSTSLLQIWVQTPYPTCVVNEGNISNSIEVSKTSTDADPFYCNYSSCPRKYDLIVTPGMYFYYVKAICLASDGCCLENGYGQCGGYKERNGSVLVAGGDTVLVVVKF